MLKLIIQKCIDFVNFFINTNFINILVKNLFIMFLVFTICFAYVSISYAKTIRVKGNGSAIEVLGAVSNSGFDIAEYTRERALNSAMKNALVKAGFFIKSSTTVTNN